jgi:DNA-binding CsgD family transcriptional regulator
MLWGDVTGTKSAARPREGELLGRQREQRRIDGVLARAADGEGAALVLHGDPGVGKTALLDYAAERGSGLQVLRTAGVEGEMELPYAALQQLCWPLLALCDSLPEPQKEALDVAFGLKAGQPPTPFLVGLAVLGLLSESAEKQPLICIVDDAHWLDRASADALGFVARRLVAERIALLISARIISRALARLPELHVGPLSVGDARRLLESALPAPLDERVLERLALEARGNPLALLELPRGLSPAELAGGFGLPAAAPFATGIESNFARRLATLPDDARRFLLLAAADPLGDPALVWRAAEQLAIPKSVADRVEAEGLLELGDRVVFRHPLVRSAVYRSATLTERRVVHGALANATDLQIDPDRRAWHRAQTASAPDEEIAVDLERSAGRALARGGLAAVAAFLERAAALTPETTQRARRLFAAARAKRDAGDLEAALTLLAGVELGMLEELESAQVDLLRAQIALEQRRGHDAGRLFLSAAHQLESVDPDLARETYLEALGGAIASEVEVAGGAVAVAAAATAAPSGTPRSRTVDVLLNAFAIRVKDGFTAAAPVFAEASELLLEMDGSNQDTNWWLSLSNGRNSKIVALEMWDEKALHLFALRQVRAARDRGALVYLQFALSFLARSYILAGELGEAAMIVDEARFIADATGNQPLVVTPLVLAAWRGQPASRSDFAAAVAGEPDMQRWSSTKYAVAVLCNGLGRHDEALEAAWEAFAPDPMGYGSLLVPELAEAASRTGDRGLVELCSTWLSDRTRVISSPWLKGIEARVLALLTEGEAIEVAYRESIVQLTGTRMRSELARSQLLYGEWLRRERRRLDAREQLRSALESFTRMGAEAFAHRAERELLATGVRARKRSIETFDELTPREIQIARLASNGDSNRDIAARLYISSSTVEYHLRNAFRKLGVKSRIQLVTRLSKLQ